MARLTALLLAAACASCGTLRPSAEDLRNDAHGHLVWAARTGDVAAIRSLAASGLDLDASSATARMFVFPDLDHTQFTALQHAVHKRQRDAVRALLEWGAEPDAAQSGAPPLSIAADADDPVLVRLLLDAGADVDKTGPEGDTPLSLAVEGGTLWGLFGGCHTETVRALVNAGARRPPDSSIWNRAVWWARLHGCQPAINEVLENPTPKDAFARRRR